MKCEKCRKEYPSKYYYKTPTVCNNCYDPENPEERKYVEEQEKTDLIKSKTRSFILVFNLSMLTFGLYILYWYYKNISDIQTYFDLNKHRVFKTAKWLYLIMISFLVLNLIIMFYKTYQASIADVTQSPDYITYTVISLFISNLFVYYFTLIVSIGQSNVGSTPFETNQIFSFYVGGSFFGFLGLIIPLASLLGIIFVFVYYYKIQKEINNIWNQAIQ